jgi:hypothetical protein
MRYLDFEFTAINSDQLNAELLAVEPLITGQSTGPFGLRVYLNTDSDPEPYRAALQAVIDAHNPASLTARQQQEADAETARGDLAAQIATTRALFQNAETNWQTLTAEERDAVNLRVIQTLDRLLGWMQVQIGD